MATDEKIILDILGIDFSVIDLFSYSSFSGMGWNCRVLWWVISNMEDLFSFPDFDFLRDSCRHSELFLFYEILWHLNLIWQPRSDVIIHHRSYCRSYSIGGQTRLLVRKGYVAFNKLFSGAFCNKFISLSLSLLTFPSQTSPFSLFEVSVRFGVCFFLFVFLHFLHELIRFQCLSFSFITSFLYIFIHNSSLFLFKPFLHIVFYST